MLREKVKSEKDRVIAKESISVATVFVIVGALFLVLCFSIVYFRYSPNSPLYKLYLKKTEVVSLGDYFNTAAKDNASGESVSVKITADQLGQAIGLKSNDFPLKKPTLSIDPEGIRLEGKTSSGFWGIKLQFQIIPTIVSERLSFKITEVKAAGVVAPPQMTSTLNPQIEALFNGAPDQIIIPKEVYSMVGYILIEGVKK